MSPKVNYSFVLAAVLIGCAVLSGGSDFPVLLATLDGWLGGWLTDALRGWISMTLILLGFAAGVTRGSLSGFLVAVVAGLMVFVAPPAISYLLRFTPPL